MLRLRLSSSAARRDASSSDGAFVASALRLSPVRGEMTGPLPDEAPAGDDRFEDAG